MEFYSHSFNTYYEIFKAPLIFFPAPDFFLHLYDLIIFFLVFADQVFDIFLWCHHKANISWCNRDRVLHNIFCHSDFCNHWYGSFPSDSGLLVLLLYNSVEGLVKLKGLYCPSCEPWRVWRVPFLFLQVGSFHQWVGPQWMTPGHLSPWEKHHCSMLLHPVSFSPPLQP